MIDLNRRGFLGGIVAIGLAAPAIVRAGNIMPIRTPVIWRPEKKTVQPAKKAWVLVNASHSVDSSGKTISKLSFEEVVCTQSIEFSRLEKFDLKAAYQWEMKYCPVVVHGMLDPYPVAAYPHPAELEVVCDLAAALRLGNLGIPRMFEVEGI